MLQLTITSLVESNGARQIHAAVVFSFQNARHLRFSVARIWPVRPEYFARPLWAAVPRRLFGTGSATTGPPAAVALPAAKQLSSWAPLIKQLKQAHEKTNILDYLFKTNRAKAIYFPPTFARKWFRARQVVLHLFQSNMPCVHRNIETSSHV